MTTPRRSKTITFSLPPEMEAQVRQVMKEDDLSVSELLRQGIRLFMEETGVAKTGAAGTAALPHYYRAGRDREERAMNDRLDLIPAALYARVSSDRQDVDLSVAAQLRALRDYAEKNGYLVAREYVDEAESGLIADRPQFRKMLDEAAKPEAPFKEISRLEVLPVHSKAGARRRLQVHAPQARASGWSPSPSRPTTPTGKLLEAIIESVDEFYSENLAQEVVRGMREPLLAASGSPAGCPTASASSWCRTGPRRGPPSNQTPQRRPWWSAYSAWPSPAGESWTSPAPSTTRASPIPPAGSGPRTASTSS